MRRVLIIKPSSLGDIVHGLQVAQSLRAQAGEVEIDWVAAKAFAPLVRACPVVDRVFEFDRQGSLAGFGRLAKEIRREHYDWALDLQGLARSAFLLIAARAKHKAGRADGREGSRLLVRQKPALPPHGRQSHALDILLQFLPLLGFEAKLSGDPLPFLHAEQSPLPESVRQARPLLMFPDSRVKRKEWPGFYDLTVKLLKDFPDLPIVWAGSRGPEPELDWPEGRFTNLLARTSLAQLPDLIHAARLVLCNDSGPMHLAAAMHRPVAALFGPTDHGRFGPYPLDDPNHLILRAPDGKMAKLSADMVAVKLKPLVEQRD